jgi:hypothetical protein
MAFPETKEAGRLARNRDWGRAKETEPSQRATDDEAAGESEVKSGGDGVENSGEFGRVLTWR